MKSAHMLFFVLHRHLIARLCVFDFRHLNSRQNKTWYVLWSVPCHLITTPVELQSRYINRLLYLEFKEYYPVVAILMSKSSSMTGVLIHLPRDARS